MLYLRNTVPSATITIVNRGKKRGSRRYYVEPSEAVNAALDDAKFWAWFRAQPQKRKLV